MATTGGSNKRMGRGHCRGSHPFDELSPPANSMAVHSKAEMISLRPFAILWADITGGFRWRADSGDFCCSLVSGVFVMQLELNVPSDLAATPTALAEDLIASSDASCALRSSPARPARPERSARVSANHRSQDHWLHAHRSQRGAAHRRCSHAEIEIRWGVTE